ncbi:MAG: hypothetical protein JRD89_01640 [Deltaproteobacteria bacterium]|nr:hypothetical protein [Deltaproteobacteria bacterium]
MILSIDPGVHKTAWALWGKDGLQEAGYHGTDAVGRFFPEYGTHLFVTVEVPQIYKHSKGDPQDLINLAFAAGQASGNRAIFKVDPKKWKGQAPKTKKLEDYLIHKWNLRALEDAEQGVYLQALSGIAASLRHNIADAVGIGLWKLQRGHYARGLQNAKP